MTRDRRYRFGGRLAVYLEPRDAWIGAYVAEDAVYVCPLPFVVIKWVRASGRPCHCWVTNSPCDCWEG